MLSSLIYLRNSSYLFRENILIIGGSDTIIRDVDKVTNFWIKSWGFPFATRWTQRNKLLNYRMCCPHNKHITFWTNLQPELLEKLYLWIVPFFKKLWLQYEKDSQFKSPSFRSWFASLGSFKANISSRQMVFILIKAILIRSQ